jgi:hypothetical protein
MHCFNLGVTTPLCSRNKSTGQGGGTNGALGKKNRTWTGFIAGDMKSGRVLGSKMSKNKGLSRDDVGAALPDAFDAEGRKRFILEEMTYEQLSEFHMRLSENDVEYHDLKVWNGDFCTILFLACAMLHLFGYPL